MEFGSSQNGEGVFTVTSSIKRLIEDGIDDRRFRYYIIV